VLVGVLGTFGVVLRELNRVRIDDVHRSGGDLALTVGGPLYTANVLGYSRAVLAAVWPDTRRVLLDLHQMRQTSVTVLDALEDLDHELEAHGVQLVVVSVPEGAAVVARRTSWFRHLEEAGRARTATTAAPAPAPAEAPSPERGDPVPPEADPAQNGSSST
jgi:MFS superfamily sulfate permease-like transporter